MNYNTFKNSLNSEVVNLNDRFNRAQWKFSPPDLDEEIAKDIHMGMQNKVNNILYQLLGWNIRDINYIRTTTKTDPICYMFEEIKIRQMESCPILCCNPDIHFSEKKCYPIYKVYQVLKKIDENAAKHLHKDEFRNIILNAVNDEEKLSSQSASASSAERTYSVFSLPDNLVKNRTIKKKIVLVIDFLDLETFNHENEVIFYTGLNNLLENIDKNFTCMLSPVLKLKEEDRWTKFLSDQIKNCNLGIILFSPKMIESLTEMRSLGLNCEPNDTVNRNESLNFLWTSVMESHKPLAGVVFDDALVQSVSSLMPVVFYLPKNMKLMLGYLIHRLQNM